ncbi:hypothetical protein K7432_004073 [Basidiobolus ranarum]|uniref:Coatomer subunit epsilon n=1 Tax=Basidiobolus ranarum TaxID=34480 RepID=A0ABR2WYW0_9FUNG
MSHDQVDELFTIRNLFYVGAYQQVINQCTNPSTEPSYEDGKLERLVFLYRSYIAQGNCDIVLKEIDDKQPIDLKVTKLLAQYVSADKAGKQKAITEAQALATDELNSNNGSVQIVLGTLLYREGLYEDALRLLVKHSKNLECVALIVQIYLKLDRTDLARRELNATKNWAEDAILAQLIEAWIGVQIGGPKYQEAFYIFQELSQNLAATTVKLLNGQAICNIHMGRYPEAESLLLEALNKSQSDPDTLVNLIVCANLTGKPNELIDDYTTQLKNIAPEHPYLTELEAKSQLFDECAKRYTIAN